MDLDDYLPIRPAPPVNGEQSGDIPINVAALHLAADEAGKAGSVGASPRSSLQGMASDLQFFTTGCLTAGTRFDRDPLGEFLLRFPSLEKDRRPVSVSYGSGFFQGFGVRPTDAGEVDFDRTMFAVPHEVWPAVRAVIGSIECRDPASNYYFRVFCYSIKLPDYPALDHAGVITEIPYVDVCVFAAAATDGTYVLSEAGALTKPKFVRLPPWQTILDKATKLRDGNLSVRDTNAF